MFNKKTPKLLDSTLVSETLKAMGDKDLAGSTKIADIMHDFHENGILLAMIFFSLPVAVPLPYPPGFTTVMGAPLILLAIQMIMGSKKVSLPEKMNNYEIKNSTLKSISDKVVPILIALEKYIKPRLGFAKSVYCEQIIGIFCLIAAISVAIPLPMTNAIPALGITVMCLGLLNRDGIVIIAGVLITIIGVVIAIGAVMGSWLLIKYVFSTLFS
jgi:hypothetical protein